MKPVTKVFECKSLQSPSSTQPGIDVALRRNLVNQPYMSNLFNFFGLGFLYGAREASGAHDTAVFWDAPDPEGLPRAAEKEITLQSLEACDPDAITLTFDLATQKETILTYRGIPAV